MRRSRLSRMLGPAILGGIILVGVILLLFARHRIVSERWDVAAQQQTIRDAQPLIEAIHAYHARHAAYPARLGRLTPEFIDAIPRPGVGGRRWTYWVSRNGDYNLTVEPAFNNAGPLSLIRQLVSPEFRYMSYSTSTGEWHVDG